jgi:hypothetical protein
MGSVHLVYDEHLGCEVALKTLNLTGGADLYRFKREFRALADVKHANLVALYELIAEGQLWFFTMEYVDGLPFDRYLLGSLPEVDGSDGGAVVAVPAERTFALDPERLIPTVQQLCAGVHAMHEMGCVHRDLKPTNVLVTEHGRVVVLDFGLAKQSGSNTLSDEGMSGTPAYMAPEQVLEQPCLPAADWYAVGTMIYEVLTGRCPFEGALFDVLLRKQTEDPPFPTQLNPQADELLSDLCMRLIHRDQAQRPSGEEILARLGVARERRAMPTIRRHTPIGTPVHNVVGRDQELQALYRAYARMRKGHLSIVAVSGSSGIGKTCLVDSFLEDLVGEGTSPTGPLVLRGRCHERETVAFKALDNVVDSLSYRLVSLSSDDQAYVLPDGILYLAEIFPVLRRLKLTEHKRYFQPALPDGKELRNQAFLAFRDLLTRMARMQPLVVFIDDLQWADRDSFALLRSLTQQPGAPSMLLVVGYREAGEAGARDSLSEFVEQTGVEALRLSPLSPDNARALAGNLLDAEDLSASTKRTIADVVVREAAGNPFFAVELVHHLRTGSVDARNGDPLAQTSFRLEEMILARVASLPELSQRLLRIVAVAGDPLPQRALAGAVGVALGADEWEHGISTLVDECLVRRRGRQGADVVECYHDRIREAVTSSLDEVTLHGLHVQLAQAVEQWERERTDMLARYWLSAEDHERAKRYACEAAAEARAKLAFDRAAQLYESAAALETDDQARAELLRSLAECQASSGRASLSADAYQRAASLSKSIHAVRLHHLASEQLLRGGQIAQGLVVLKQVLRDAGIRLASTPRRAAIGVAFRVIWLRIRGVRFVERPASSITDHERRLLDVLWSVNIGLGVVDTLRADDVLLRFLFRALRAGDIRRVAQGLGIMSGQLAALGGARFRWALRLSSEAEVLALRAGDSATIGLTRMCKAIVRYFVGEFDEAANDLVAVEQYFLSHCHGVGWELATTRSFACFSLRLSGRIRELCDRFDRYTADADRAGDRYLAANLRTYQSIVWLIRDDQARAARDIEGILDGWPADMYHVQHFFHLYARCEQALYGDVPRVAMEAVVAEELRLRRSALLHVSGIRIEWAWIKARVALAVAETLAEADRGPYLRLAHESARVLRKAEHQTGVAMGAAVEAGVGWLTPGANRDDGIRALEHAIAVAEAAGAKLIAASGRRWLGEILGGRKGEELRARSNGWMAEQGVEQPVRIAHLIAPGFRGRDA